MGVAPIDGTRRKRHDDGGPDRRHRHRNGLALLGSSPVFLAASAFVFGNAFFAVVTSTTAFSRLNYPAVAWPRVIGIMTITFGLGQTLGPFVTGAVTDVMGLSYALNISTAALALGAVLCALQRPLAKRSAAG